MITLPTPRAGAAAPRLFLYGYFGFRNVGDDLLLRSVVSQVLRQAPAARFVLRSLEPVPVPGLEGSDILNIDAIVTDRSRPRAARLLRFVREAWAKLRGCTHLVFCGGTVFHARGPWPASLVLIAVLVLLARCRGARVYALGAGVGPLRGAAARLLMWMILALHEDFAARDASSFAQCRALTAGRRLRLTADLVFSLPLAVAPAQPRAARVLGVTLAASDLGSSGSGHEAFLGQVAAAIGQLAAAGWNVRLLSFQELHGEMAMVSDSALFATVRTRLPGVAFEEKHIESTPEAIAREFAGLDVVVGMRFHGLVIAAMLGKPFLGFGREGKLADLCARFDMPFLAIDGFAAGPMAAAVDGLRGRRVNPLVTAALVRDADGNFTRLRESLA